MKTTPPNPSILCFPGTVRVDVVSTHSIEYPKARQARLPLRLHPGRPPPPRLYRQCHGHLAERGFLRPAHGPAQRGRRHRGPQSPSGLELRVSRRSRRHDPGHPSTKPGSAGSSIPAPKPATRTPRPKTPSNTCPKQPAAANSSRSATRMTACGSCKRSRPKAG